MEILTYWLVSALAIAIAAFVLPGVTVAGLTPALITAVALGLVNGLIRPVITLLTLPINILTLGLFSLVINAALIMLVSSLVSGFMVDGFLSALLFSVVLSVVNLVLMSLFANGNKR